MPQVSVAYSCGATTGVGQADPKLDLLQGTLDLMVLQTLETMGALHGYGIARRIEQLIRIRSCEPRHHLCIAGALQHGVGFPRPGSFR